MKNIIILIFLLHNTAVLAQNGIDSTSYLARLIVSPSQRSKLMLFQYSYLFTPNAHSFASKGGHITVGLNISRFFTEKYFFGVFIHFKNLPGGFSQNFSQRFKDAFNNSYMPISSPAEAQMESETLYGVVNELDGYKCLGNTFSGFGIGISPFPDRWGSFLLKISKGGNRVMMTGPYDEVLNVKKDDSYFSVEMKTIFSLELVFKPFTFRREGAFSIYNATWKKSPRLITVSLYMEQLKMKDGLFRNTQLSSFINPTFFNNQPRIYNYGFKLGIGLW